MNMREIPAIEWPEFLEQFSRGHRAWLATIERLRPGAPRATEAVERPLASVTPDVRARRVVGIDIRFLDDSHAREAIRIDAPASLRVDETAEGTVRGVEIQDERGECVRIQFRAAPLPEALDGIAPRELPT
jgi:hypothetical protein